jgi:hypothetical protein
MSTDAAQCDLRLNRQEMYKQEFRDSTPSCNPSDYSGNDMVLRRSDPRSVRVGMADVGAGVFLW